jgi:hypothetical protein
MTLDQPKYTIICPITSQTLFKNKYGRLEWVKITPKGEWKNSEFTEREILNIEPKLMEYAKQIHL